jgi:hypothetical protein
MAVKIALFGEGKEIGNFFLTDERFKTGSRVFHGQA